MLAAWTSWQQDPLDVLGGPEENTTCFEETVHEGDPLALAACSDGHQVLGSLASLSLL